MPLIHLPPRFTYKDILKIGKEETGYIKGVMNIRQTKCSMEFFEKVLKGTDYTIVNLVAFFINPHYEVKFGLKTRKLYMIVYKLFYGKK